MDSAGLHSPVVLGKCIFTNSYFKENIKNNSEQQKNNDSKAEVELSGEKKSDSTNSNVNADSDIGAKFTTTLAGKKDYINSNKIQRKKLQKSFFKTLFSDSLIFWLLLWMI